MSARTLSISGMELSLLRLSTITGMRSGCFALMLAALALRDSRSCFESLAMAVSLSESRWSPLERVTLDESRWSPPEEGGVEAVTPGEAAPRRGEQTEEERPLVVLVGISLLFFLPLHRRKKKTATRPGQQHVGARGQACRWRLGARC